MRVGVEQQHHFIILRGSGWTTAAVLSILESLVCNVGRTTAAILSINERVWLKVV